MIYSQAFSGIRNLIYLLLASLLSSCAFAPGMHAPSVDGDYAETNAGTISVTPIRYAIKQKSRSADLPKVKLPSTSGYRVGARDVLRVTVWNHPQLMSGKEGGLMGFPVQADGTFFFPYAGKVQAQGRTVDDIRIQLTRRLKPIVKTPQVSVSVMRYGSQRVYVLGAVEKPRMLPLEGYALTLMEAIALCGGLTEQASGLKAYLLRNGERYEIRLSELMNHGDISQNLILQDGDVLHIPDNRDEKIYVLGAVKQPKSVYMVNGDLSLSEALVESGGLDALSADANNVYVIRNDAGKPRIFHIDMQYPDALLVGEQFAMQPRDVIYVATSKVAQWNKVLNLIMPNIQSLFYLDALVR